MLDKKKHPKKDSSTKNYIKYEDRLAEHWWIHWQKIRRNPHYRKFCDQHKFDNHRRLLEEKESSREIIDTKNQFHLKTIYHYSKEFSKKECFENFDIFKDREAVVRIWPEARIDSEGPQSFIPPSLPEYGSFIYLGINIDKNVKWEDIKSEIHRHVDFARAIRGISKEDRRLHLDKISTYLKIWDMRSEQMPFSKIALHLNSSEDSVKKQFQKAFELITDKKYNRNSWRNLIQQKLERNVKELNGKYDKDIWEKFLKFIDKKQQHKLINGNITNFEDLDNKYSLISFELKLSIQQTCKKCSDTDCCKNMLKALEIDNYDSCADCPKIYDLLST